MLILLDSSMIELQQMSVHLHPHLQEMPALVQDDLKGALSAEQSNQSTQHGDVLVRLAYKVHQMPLCTLFYSACRSFDHHSQPSFEAIEELLMKDDSDLLTVASTTATSDETCFS